MNVKFDHTKDQIDKAVGVTDTFALVQKSFSKLTDNEKVALAGIGYNVLRADENKLLSFIFNIEADVGSAACVKIGETIANETKVSKVLETLMNEYPDSIDKLAFIGRIELLSKILNEKEEV